MSSVPSSELVLGVDFGTTNTVVAIVREKDGIKDVEVLANDIGSRTTPSCVYLDPTPTPAPAPVGLIDKAVQYFGGKKSKRSDGRRSVQVGEAALRLCVSDPGKTVRNVKSVLGRAYLEVRDDPTSPLGCIKIGGSTSGNAVAIHLESESNSVVAPEELAASLLIELKKTVEENVGSAVTKAVIAVPAYFNAAQRQAVKDAAFLAGLEVVQLVNETTAAALDFAYEREGTKTLLMVDVGGGGSSVSVVRVHEGAVSVLATSGRRLPGGEDFDRKMVEHLLKVVKDKHQKEVMQDDVRTRETIRSSWEKAKQKLSRIPQVPICHYLASDINEDFRHVVTRNHFEEECESLFKEIVSEMNRVLHNSELKPHQVDDVVLVGGSTRIPRLRELIQNALGDQKQLCKAINPDEAVARGAALLGARCVRLEKERVSLLTRMYQSNKLVRRVELNESLPQTFQLTPYDKGYIKVEQGINNPSMVRLMEMKINEAYEAELNVSGLLEFHDRSKKILPFFFSSCLSEKCRSALKKNITNQVEGAEAEFSRVEAKNLLEDKVRTELTKEVIEDKFAEDDRRLRAECQEVLVLLQSESNISAEDSSKHRESITDRRTWIDQEREKVAAEIRRKQTETDLRTLLRSLVDEKADQDHWVPDMTKTCVEEWRNEWEWLKSRLDHSYEDLVASLNRVTKRRDELKLARDNAKADAERRRIKATDRLKCLVKSILALKPDEDIHAPDAGAPLLLNCKETERWLDKTSENLVESYDEKYTVLIDLKRVWDDSRQRRVAKLYVDSLKSALNMVKSQPLDEFVESFKSEINEKKCHFQKCSKHIPADDIIIRKSKLEEEMRNFTAGQESRRRQARDKLAELLGQLQMKIAGNVNSRKEACDLQEECSKQIEWFREHEESATRAQFGEKLQKLMEHSDLLDKAVAEEKRLQSLHRLKLKLNEVAEKQIHPKDVAQDLEKQLRQLCVETTQWVASREKTGEEKQFLQRLQEIVSTEESVAEKRCLRLEARYQLENRLRKAISIQPGVPASVREEAERIRYKWLPRWEWLADHRTESEEKLSQYCTEVDTDLNKLAELLPAGEPMDVDGDSDYSPAEFQQAKAPAQSASVNTKDLMVQMLRHIQLVLANQQWLSDRPATSSVPQEVQDHPELMLHCLAEEVAVETLRQAGAAGCMALIVNKAVTSERELVSLAARFVRDDGQAVERLIAVREVHHDGGDARVSTVANQLLQDFSTLCHRAEVKWGTLVRSVSALGVGQDGNDFLKLLRDHARDTNGKVDEVGNSAMRLDERVVLEFHELAVSGSGPSQTISAFFSTVGGLQKLFGVRSKWHRQLRDSNRYLMEKDDPFATYKSSVHFLADEANRKVVAEALKKTVRCDPESGLLINIIAKKLESAPFRAWLYVFDDLFKCVPEQCEASPSGDASSVIIFPALHIASPLSPGECQRLQNGVESCLGKDVEVLRGSLSSTVHHCVDTTSRVVEQYRDELQILHLVQRSVLAPQAEPPRMTRSQTDALGCAFFDELRGFMSRNHPPIDSLQSLLVAVREHASKYPALHDAVLRVLTAPLLPPAGLRSSEQLREGLRLAAACPADRIAALVVLLSGPDPPPGHVFDRAVTALAARLPDLQVAASRMETQL